MTNFTVEEDSSNSGGDFVGQSSTNTAATDTAVATSKHLTLKVPDYEFEDMSISGRSDAAIWDPVDSKKNSLLVMGDATEQSQVSAIVGQAFKGNDLLRDSDGASRLSFIDDTRERGVATSPPGAEGGTGAMTTPPNEYVARQTSKTYSNTAATSTATGDTAKNAAASAAIPEYVGWRDHCDGHRITTTRGDKIEVVGGNYKLISLGRGGGEASYEMSGGVIVDGDEPPGDITSASWVECPTQGDLTTAEKALLASGSTASKKFGWKLTEETVRGNTVERFHGTKREEFYGNELISVIGSAGEETSGLKNSVDATESFVAGDRGDKRAWPTQWDAAGEDTPPKLQRPAVSESTWAASITEYTKSWGDKSEEVYVEGKSTEKSTFKKSHTSQNHLNGVGQVYRETWYLMGSAGFQEAFFGAFSQFFFGMSTTLGIANRMETFIGLEEQLNLGAILEIRTGISTEIFAGQKHELETASYKFWLAKKDGGVTIKQMFIDKGNAGLTRAGTWLAARRQALADGVQALRVRLG